MMHSNERNNISTCQLLFSNVIFAGLIVFFYSIHAYCQLSLWVPDTLHNI